MNEGAGESPAEPNSTVRFTGIWGVEEQRAILDAIARAERRISTRCDWRCRCDRRDGRYEYRIELSSAARILHAQSLEEVCRQLERWDADDSA